MEKTEYTLTIDAKDAEETLDRITAKAEKLLSVMQRIKDLQPGAPLEATELLQAPANNIQRIDVVLTYCDLVSILNSPAEGFTPEFIERVHELAPLMFKARPQVKGEVPAKPTKEIKIPIAEA